ncbi:MAG: fatty acid cis/trans isomerase [Gammaproteobacteria bacterium]
MYTIVRNKSYLNTTSLGLSEKNRVESEDTIDIAAGFVGAYPNFFFELKYEDLDNFIGLYAEIDSYAKYNALVELYGIRRTNPKFWETSDWFYEKFKHDYPRYAGVFDLNRYQNR